MKHTIPPKIKWKGKKKSTTLEKSNKLSVVLQKTIGMANFQLLT